MSNAREITNLQAPEMNPSEIAVTCIVPVFNKEHFLHSCLESLRSQTLRNLEIICINDGSTDACTEILDAHKRDDDRIRVFESPTNRGAGVSRNIGIEMARGRYVRFVDADDLLPLDSTAVMYRRAVDSGADVVRGSLALFRGNDLQNRLSVVSVPNRESTSFRDESSLWVPWWHTSYLISRELIRDRRLQYPSLVQGEDPVFLASVLVNAERISMMEDIVYLYRKYPKSTGSGQSTFNSINAMLEHASIVKSLYTLHSPQCWHAGYGPYLLDDLKKILKRSNLNASQMAAVEMRAAEIWDDAATPDLW